MENKANKTEKHPDKNDTTPKVTGIGGIGNLLTAYLQ